MNHKRLFLSLGVALILAGSLAACLYTGILWFNNPSPVTYPIRGIDVSHHQGTINWELLARQGLHFAYIKATEGGDFKDTRFAENWKNARNTHLAVGAYHFFLPGKSGVEQAHNFITTVKKEPHALPPMLDVECAVVQDAAKRRDIRQKIGDCLRELEEHYGKKPVIYATFDAYEAYIKDEFSEYPLWIRSIFISPQLSGKQTWAFWQYSNRGRLDGFSGNEKYIDMNVFNGSQEDFALFTGP